MADTFFQIEVKYLKSQNEDRFSGFAFEQGASGVAEDLSFNQGKSNYQPQVLDKEVINLHVFFESKPPEDFFLKAKSEFPEVEIYMREEQNKDWLEEWKKGFEAFPLAEPFWIVPSWKSVPEGVSQPIFVDPGMAFGTGTHETTQLVAEAMMEHLRSPSPKRLLDVGTGTGILAILASKLAVESIDAIDVDKDALRVAYENCEKNQVDNVKILKQMSQDLKTPYDWVIANIIDGVLIKLGSDLYRLTKPGGKCLVSGILEEHMDEFEKEFIKKNGFEIISRKSKGEWVSYFLNRPNESDL